MIATRKQITFTLLASALTWIACAGAQASECPMNPELGRNPPEVVALAEDENIPGIFMQITIGGIGRSDVSDKDAAYTLGCSTLELSTGSVKGSFKLLRFSWDRPEEYVIDTNGHDPWGNLYEVSLGVNRGGMITEHMSYALMLGATSAYEREISDSFSFYGGGYGMFAINPKWTISAGALYLKHQKVESDFEVIPVASVSWNTGTSSGPSFTIGLPKTELTWHFSKTNTLTIDTSGFESGIYRLANNSPVRKKGYVEFSGTTCSLRIDTLIADRIGLTAGISQALSRKHKLFDHEGKNEIKYDAEKKPGFFVSMAMSF
jgi:hypothetical protein